MCDGFSTPLQLHLIFSTLQTIILTSKIVHKDNTTPMKIIIFNILWNFIIANCVFWLSEKCLLSVAWFILLLQLFITGSLYWKNKEPTVP
jgi:hypothetical protein